MTMPIRRATLEVWHFRCPECGFGDAELGFHFDMDMVFCEVCLEEGQHVRLNRWPVAESRSLPRRRG